MVNGGVVFVLCFPDIESSHSYLIGFTLQDIIALVWSIHICELNQIISFSFKRCGLMFDMF